MDAMTEQSEPGPSLTDVMGALTALSAGVAQLAEDQRHSESRLTARLDQLEDRMIDRFAKAREDAAGIKLAVAGLESGERDTAEAVRRHLGDDDAHRRAA